jgi:tRNA U34 5-methylaminomethyl-2-thiouridine-forming methyltransferase MnmC
MLIQQEACDWAVGNEVRWRLLEMGEHREREEGRRRKREMIQIPRGFKKHR